MNQPRVNAQLSAMDIEILFRGLIELRLAANVSATALPTRGHRDATERLLVRLEVLGRQLGDSEAEFEQRTAPLRSQPFYDRTVPGSLTMEPDL